MRAEIPERPPAADAGPPASNSGREFLSETKIFGSSTSAPEKVPQAASPIAVNGQARQQLLSRLQQHITAELGFTEVLDPNERLNDLGVDSLMSVTCPTALKRSSGFRFRSPSSSTGRRSTSSSTVFFAN